MTLILAMSCPEGMVLASDSQATFATQGQHVRGITQKLYQPWSNLAWGASGNVGLIQHIEQELRKRFSNNRQFVNTDPRKVQEDITKAIVSVARPKLKDQYISIRDLHDPSVSFLF